MARRMRGYDDAQARQICRDLIDMPADVAITEREIRVRFHRRAHLPIVLASGLIDKPVPSGGGTAVPSEPSNSVRQTAPPMPSCQRIFTNEPLRLKERAITTRLLQTIQKLTHVSL
jgi:hypothetical protein